MTIGRNVFIGPNVSILTPIHPLRFQERNPFFHEKTGNVTNLERAGSPCRVLRSITEEDSIHLHPEYFEE